jgi:hypothetical protein
VRRFSEFPCGDVREKFSAQRTHRSVRCTRKNFSAMPSAMRENFFCEAAAMHCAHNVLLFISIEAQFTLFSALLFLRN